MIGGAIFYCLDVLARPRFGEDPDRLARARVVAGILLAQALALLLSALLVAAGGVFGDASTLVMAVMTAYALAHFGLAVGMRQRGSLALYSHLLMTLSVGMVYGGVLVTGGPSEAGAQQLTIILPVLAFFLTGLYGGLLWTGGVVVVQALLFWLELRGYPFPQLQTAEALRVSVISNWTIAFAVLAMILSVFETNRERLKRQRDLERERYRYLATHDSLTRLASRSLFEKRLHEAIAECPEGMQVLLLYLDLDNFKPINDRWGHATGDRVLTIIGARLQAMTREQDLVARLGGDEFALLLPRFPIGAAPEAIASAVRDKLHQPIHLYGQQFLVECSVGLALYPKDAADAEQLWARADSAMYAAKRARAEETGSPAART